VLGSLQLGRSPVSLTEGGVRQEFSDTWDDLAAVQLDVGHEGFVGQATSAVLQVQARGIQRAQVGGDLLGDGLGGSDIEGALWPGLVAKDSSVGMAKCARRRRA
jgi:hypothetical protein